MDGAIPENTSYIDEPEKADGETKERSIRNYDCEEPRNVTTTHEKSSFLSGKETIRSTAQLSQLGLISPTEEPAIERVLQKFDVAISPAMLDLIDTADCEDPIAKQFVPDQRELTEALNENSDPIGDHAYSAIPGIIHRYPDRVLLTPLLTCPVYCRFCFRREDVGSGSHALTSEQLEAALTYIEKNTEIWEVILSGGDPLLLSPRRLTMILARLSNIPHVGTVRIHTRVPVVCPEKINADLLTALCVFKPVYVVLHANHPREFSVAATAACAELVDAGIPMLSQTVLLRGINTDVSTLTQLMRRFVENRIKPYYLHHADLARGTGHFRIPLEQGQDLIRELRGDISGLCQPTYVLDMPGGGGKSPVGPNYVRTESAGEYVITDYRGNEHSYVENGAS